MQVLRNRMEANTHRHVRVPWSGADSSRHRGLICRATEARPAISRCRENTMRLMMAAMTATGAERQERGKEERARIQDLCSWTAVVIRGRAGGLEESNKEEGR